MATNALGFTERERRDSEYQRLKAEGKKGVGKYTTHEGNSPQIIYVVSYVEESATAVAK